MDWMASRNVVRGTASKLIMVYLWLSDIFGGRKKRIPTYCRHHSVKDRVGIDNILLRLIWHSQVLKKGGTIAEASWWEQPSTNCL